MSTAPGLCPSWCTVDHENAVSAVRRITHMAAEDCTVLRNGTVFTRAWWSGYAEDAPDVFINLPGAERPEVCHQLVLDPDSARGLAVLVGLLADATPDQHRQIAAQAHAAADAITGKDGAR